MTSIKAAYEKLSDSKKRNQYDRFIKIEKDKKINKLKEDIVTLRIILMQLMTTQQIQKLPGNAIIKIMIDKIPVGSDLYIRLFQNNKIDKLSKKEQKKLFAVVNYSEKILGEIMSEVCTNAQLKEDSIDEYIDTIAAMQKAVTTGDTTEIDHIRERSSRFDYYLGVIVKNIKKLGQFSIFVAASFAPMTMMYVGALGASSLLIDSIPNKLNEESSLMLHSHSLNEEIKKEKNSFKEILTKIAIKNKYNHLLNEDEHPTIDNLKEKLALLSTTLMQLMTTEQIKKVPKDSLIQAIINKISIDSALYVRIF